MTARQTELVNAFETTLAAQLAAGGTSMNLTDNPVIDAPAYFVIDPDNESSREIVLWSSGTNHASAPVTRDVDGKYGTAGDAATAPTHSGGTTVRLAVVKQHIDEVHEAVQQGFILEDDDGTEVEIKPAVASGVYTAREVKFIGTGVDIDWTDVDNGTDGDPYDLTFTLDINDLDAGAVAQAADSIAILDADDSVTKKESIADFVDAINGAGIDASSGTLVNAVVGKQSMWIPAAAMYPTQTAGCAAIAGLDSGSNTGPDLYTLDFDASTTEHAQFSVAFPSYWNESTITFQVYWTSEATDTDGVSWALKGVAFADSDSINTAFGTAIQVTDDAISAAKDLYITAVSNAVTIAGSPAAGELAYFDIARDHDEVNDDMAEDAKLIGIKIFYTVDDVHEA